MDDKVTKIKIDIAELYQKLTASEYCFSYSGLGMAIVFVAGLIIAGTAVYEGIDALLVFGFEVIFIILLGVLGYFFGRSIDRKFSLKYFEKNFQDISTFINLEEVKVCESESFRLTYSENAPIFQKYFDIFIINGKTYIHNLDKFKSEFSFDELIAEINRLLEIAMKERVSQVEQQKIEEQKKRENIDSYHQLR